MPEYKIIFAGDYQELSGLVTEEILDGWQPAGGVALDGGDTYANFYQAMTKKEDDGLRDAKEKEAAMTSQEANIALYGGQLTNLERGQLLGMLDVIAAVARAGAILEEWDHWKEPISLAVRRALQARGFKCWAASNIFRVTWGLLLDDDAMMRSEEQFNKAAQEYRRRFPDAPPLYQSVRREE